MAETQSTFTPEEGTFQECVRVWACPQCGFAFDAEHVNDDATGNYTCPVCENAAQTPAWQLRNPDDSLVYGGLSDECPGYEYYGHEPLDIDGYYETCEYVEGKGFDDVPLAEVEEDVNGPDNQKIIALVRQALQRDNPLDEWLNEQLNAANVGDTANRECAYLTVMTNMPHPPCNGTGRIEKQGAEAVEAYWAIVVSVPRELAIIRLHIMCGGDHSARDFIRWFYNLTLAEQLAALKQALAAGVGCG